MFKIWALYVTLHKNRSAIVNNNNNFNNKIRLISLISDYLLTIVLRCIKKKDNVAFNKIYHL